MRRVSTDGLLKNAGNGAPFMPRPRFCRPRILWLQRFGLSIDPLPLLDWGIGATIFHLAPPFDSVHAAPRPAELEIGSRPRGGGGATFVGFGGRHGGLVSADHAVFASSPHPPKSPFARPGHHRVIRTRLPSNAGGLVLLPIVNRRGVGRGEVHWRRPIPETTTLRWNRFRRRIARDRIIAFANRPMSHYLTHRVEREHLG